jgi:tetratricopeptide (TPR) repeat protein
VSLRSIAFGIIFLALPLSLRAQDTPAPDTAAPAEDTDQSPYHVALLAYKAGDYQKAFDALDSPDGNTAVAQDQRALILKSRILAELKRYDEGEKLLKSALTPTGPIEIELALGDLFLRKHSFDRAGKYYNLALAAKPNDPDITLKIVYSQIGASDLVDAAKSASQLKPLDPDHPCYYFAKAALAQATTGADQEAGEDIETARTIYGITVTNRYLKTYLQVFAQPEKGAASRDIIPPPLVKPAPAAPPASPQ